MGNWRDLREFLSANRAHGHTKAATVGAQASDGLLVCATREHAEQVISKVAEATGGEGHLAAVGLSSLHYVHPCRRPIVVDNHAIVVALNEAAEEVIKRDHEHTRDANLRRKAYDDLSADYAKCRKQRDEYKGSADARLVELQKYESEVAYLRGQRDELQAANLALASAAENREWNKLREENRALTSERDSLRRQVDQKNTELDLVRREKANLDNQKVTWLRERDKWKADLERVNSGHTAAANSYNEGYARLKAELEAHQERTLALVRECSKLRVDNERLVREVDSLRRTQDTLVGEVDAANRVIFTLERMGRVEPSRGPEEVITEAFRSIQAAGFEPYAATRLVEDSVLNRAKEAERKLAECEELLSATEARYKGAVEAQAKLHQTVTRLNTTVSEQRAAMAAGQSQLTEYRGKLAEIRRVVEDAGGRAGGLTVTLKGVAEVAASAGATLDRLQVQLGKAGQPVPPPLAPAALMNMVMEFHRKFGHPVRNTPGVPSEAEARFRVRLIMEEFFEYLEAVFAPDFPEEERAAWRKADLGRIKAELSSWCDICPVGALTRGRAAEIADALVDLEYVLAGTHLVYGFPRRPILEEVHRANMAKDPAVVAGKDAYHASGGVKPVKPAGWKGPDVDGILMRNGFPRWNASHGGGY